MPAVILYVMLLLICNPLAPQSPQAVPDTSPFRRLELPTPGDIRTGSGEPTPADFFRTIEDGVGEDLSSFWRGWFYTTAGIDQAVDSVVLSDTAGVVSRVHLRNTGAMPMPVELAVTLSGGKTLRIRLPVEVWYQGSTYAAVVPGDVTGVRVDPDEALPDLDRGNNVWPRPGPARSP